jgi:mannose-6-phosphate isomerase-like protein (cupin superfamily)
MSAAFLSARTPALKPYVTYINIMSRKELRPMEELDKALGIALRGPQAERVLVEFRQQAAAWGVVMPPVEPLVLDFGLGDFRRIGLIEYWIANEAQAGYCGKYLFVFDGQTCPTHHHRTKHETFFLVKGRARVTCGDLRREMQEGDVLTVVPGTPHSFTGAGPALFLELSMPCEVDDNYFADETIPIGGNYRGRQRA